MAGQHALVLLTAAVLLLQTCRGQVLTPPYLNLAQGRRIVASATCGEGVSEPELYCKLAGGTGNEPANLIQGQQCDYCDPRDPSRAHPVSQAVDGTEKWWQSPPLSRGTDYNKVNVTISLGQLFHVAYVVLKFANAPRPGVWVLERSTDFGQTYKPWQYFADTPSDCYNVFGVTPMDRPTHDDSVTCTTEYSNIVPLENGEIHLSLVNGRPSSKNFTHSSMLHEWTKATNVRLRFLRTKTLLGHLMAVTQQDPTVTRRYFYSLKDISIGGRCVCNGHADECDGTGSADPNRLVCKCQHNTCGESCEQCCPGFVQKPWQPATPNNLFECEACNCLGHSSECYYDPEVAQNRLSLDMRGDFNGGGVCTNCQHNTEGINCERCKPGFFRVPDTPLTSPYVCQSCQCNSFFTTGTCEQLTGHCYCLPGYAGDDCNQCASGYVGFPNCKAELIKKTKSRTNLEPEVYIPLTSEIVDIPPPPPYSQPEVVQPTPGYDGGYSAYGLFCECHMNGTAGFTCSVEGDGQCPCKYNYAGRYCEGCALGYYNFPECLPCNCDEAGSLSHRCDIQQGQCECRSGFMGRTCDRCATGYYNYPRCTSCDCNVMGSTQEVCDRDTGTCLCQEPFTGQRCDQCKSGSYSFPNCIRCNCYGAGVLDDDSKACTDSGQCTCKPAYAGMSCEKCAPGYYGYPDCKSCSCESGGSIGSDCDPRSGQCRCKEHVEGRNCDKCQVGFFNFPNCLECNCNPAGRAPNTECPSVQTMTCDCKSLVEGPDCDQCKPLYWNLLKDNPEGCEECGCFRPGTSSGLGTCDMAIGQCACKANVQGRICMDCRDGSFGMSEVDSLGCQGCSCDVGGAVTDVCDKATGQCVCREGMEGRQCDIPTQGQYVPGLYQYKYEAEDADTPRGMPVRFGYSEKDFPGFSWRGYAIMNTVQPRIILSVLVDRPALYRVVLSYVNPGQETVIGNIRANPLSQSADVVSQQSSEIVFNPTTDPMTVTVVGNSFIMPFVLNPGQWSFTIEVSRVLLDYMVLLPAAYFEAPLLQLKVEVPCKYEIPEDPKDHCLMYTHLPLEDFTTVQAESGFFRPQQDDDDMNNTLSVLGDKIATQYIQPSKFYPLMALLDHNQMVLLLELTLPKAGEYVFVIEYANFETRAQTLQIRVDKTEGKNQGIFNINTCNFSFRCRAVGIDDNGREARFKVTSRSTTISLSGDKLRVAIDSLTAIPVKSWDPDYIIPKPLCVASYGPFSNHKKRADPRCVQSMYTEPVGTVRILPSSGQDSMRRQPLLVLANSKLFLLDREQNQLEFSGRLLSAGRTVFLLHYFQPESTGYTAQVKVTTPLRQEIQGVIQVDYCPHSAGCRATMLFAGLGEQVDITQPDIRIMITIPADRTIWVDHVVAIPEFSYTPSLLMDSRIDKSGDFIKQCGKFDFNLNERDLTPFCRKSIMSLSAHYNDGANPCNCNPQGSSSQTCSPLGGQCPCKDNIVGRSCDVCATGYFGFPNCRECPCGENRLCDPVTGECICPPRSRQPECTVCEEGTYGYHPLLGCEPCDCDAMGILDLNYPSCNRNTGQCSCKPNVGGRRCDRCLPGYYNFPYCSPCSCSADGVTEDVCDQRTGRCLCKTNVNGQRCDQCKANTYHLSTRNPEGCHSCFCFGATPYCRSSDLHYTELLDMEDWTVSNQVGSEVMRFNDKVEVKLGDLIQPDEPVYWVAPGIYLGNLVTSYGGSLTYTVEYQVTKTALMARMRPTRLPDVLLSGNDMTIMYSHPVIPEPDEPLTVTVDLLEGNFVHSNSKGAVSREDLLMVLADLQALLIRASYREKILSATIESVKLSITTQTFSGKPALDVEYCNCPYGYKGTSCQECDEGYYRSKTGPYLGQCVKCECYGHASSCDENGACIDCEHHTMGDRCDKCMTGYYGEPRRGTPDDCQICACPMATEDNNFASECQPLAGGQFQCTCLPGYDGPNCDRCAIGFYGKPSEVGGFCQRCDCSGNVRLTKVGMKNVEQCDAETGQCLDCLDNTGGRNCQKCAAGFYGDAMKARSCTKCRNCDVCGTVPDVCDDKTGKCLCRDHVVGDKCDQCEENHYGFDSCQGCQACDCSAEGSLEKSCHPKTGQCTCKPGVTGRRCDRCEPKHSNFTSSGCRACNCPKDGPCDPQTGECRCPEGLTGTDCESCKNETLLYTPRGCWDCDTCVHSLMDYVNNLGENTDLMKMTIVSLSAGQIAGSRVNDIIKGVEEAKMNIDKMKALAKEIDDVEDDGLRNVSDKYDAFKDKVDQLKRDGDQLSNRVDIADQLAMSAKDKVEAAVEELKKIKERAENGSIVDPEAAIAEAQEILDNLTKYRDDMQANIDTRKKAAEDEQRNANADLKLRARFLALVGQREDQARKVRDKVDSFLQKIGDDVQSAIFDTNWLISEAAVLNARNTPPPYEDEYDELHKLKMTIDEILGAGMNLRDQANKQRDEIKAKLKEIARRDAQLDGAKTSLQTKTSEMTKQQPELTKKVQAAEEYISTLDDRVLMLEGLLSRSKSQAENASLAVNAYGNIVDWFTNALGNATEAKERATDAKKQVDDENLPDKASTLHGNSQHILGNSTEMRDIAEEYLIEMGRRKEGVNESGMGLEVAQMTFSALKEGQSALERAVSTVGDMDTDLEDAERKTKEAVEKADIVLEEVAKIAGPDAEPSGDDPSNILKDGVKDEEEDREEDEKKKRRRGNRKRGRGRKGRRGKKNHRKPRDVDEFKGAELAEDEEENETGGQGLTLDKMEEVVNRMQKDSVDMEPNLNNAEKSLDDLEDDVENMEDNVIQANFDIQDAESIVKRLSREGSGLMEQITPLAEELKSLHTSVQQRWEEMKRNITNLKRQVAQAKDQANRIMVPMKFNRKSSVLLKPPAEIKTAATFLDLTLFVKTEAEDNFIFYMGNKQQPNKDFIALETVKGQLYFYFNLGGDDGMVSTTTTINTNQWTKINIRRVGREGEIYLEYINPKTSLTEDELVVGEATGDYTVLDLNPQSVFYIGGLPDGFKSPPIIKNRHMDGCVESVSFDSEPVGLWNFLSAENVDVEGDDKPCMNRDVLTENTHNSFYFDGEGYANIPKKILLEKSTSWVDFKLKTVADNALLFFASGPTAYVSIEIKDGYIVMQADFGEGNLVLKSKTKYNNGNAHKITVRFDNYNMAQLKIQAEPVAEGTVPGSGARPYIGDRMFIGGHSGDLPDMVQGKVISEGLKGCMQDFSITRRIQTFYGSRALQKGITAGCPTTVTRVASFREESYLSMPMFTDEEYRNIEMILTFRTVKPDGLIMFTANEDQSQALSISLKDGGVIMSVKSQSSYVEVRSREKSYNDSRDHNVWIRKDGVKLTLIVDNEDRDEKRVDASFRELLTPRPIYFGGVPITTRIRTGVVASTEGFEGCISDVALNRPSSYLSAPQPEEKEGIVTDIEDYSNALELYEVSLAGCFVEEPPMPTVRPRPSAIVDTDTDEPVKTTVPAPAPSPTAAKTTTAAPERKQTPAVTPSTGGAEKTPTTEQPEKRPTQKPVTKGPKLAPEPSCALKLRPELGDAAEAFQFGVTSVSRMEYNKLPDSFRIRYKFSMEFKTFDKSGLLFFMADNLEANFVTLFLTNGNLIYMFNCGTGKLKLKSRTKFNDGQWHRVEFSRELQRGTLTVDGLLLKEGQSPGNSSFIDAAEPYYVGGLPSLDVAKKLPDAAKRSFDGCIRDLRMNDQPWGEPTRSYSVGVCYQSGEVGTFFTADGGFLVVDEEFQVGMDIEVTMEIRPRTTSGVLMAVMSQRGDFLLIQLINGTVVAHVQNGGGVFSIQPKDRHELCDGQWHKIEVTKAKNVLMMEVDEKDVVPPKRDDNTGDSRTDTNDPLYLGGVPDDMKTHELVVKETYVGCMRNVKVNDIGQDFRKAARFSGGVIIDTCPTN
ncbi:laminin subunit alpha-5-like isoform X1 [Branchiostoma floridae x Branchiostoma belcheri]